MVPQTVGKSQGIAKLGEKMMTLIVETLNQLLLSITGPDS